jgi:hypothetical protein
MNRREVFTSLGAGLVLAGSAPILLRRPVGEVFWHTREDWLYRSLGGDCIARIPVRYWAVWSPNRLQDTLIRYDVAFWDDKDKYRWNQWGVDAGIGERKERLRYLVKVMQKHNVRYMRNGDLYIPPGGNPNTVGILI